MKQGKATGIILAVLNVILIVVCAVLYFRTDRTAPKIEFQAAETVYRESMGEAGFLEGITAYDSNDGDITDRIVVEKTIGNRADNTIVIFYAVSDRSGNVAKASRVFRAIYDGENITEQSDSADRFLEAGINAELKQDSIQSETSEDGESKLGEEENDVSPEEGSTEVLIPAETPLPAAPPAPTATPVPAQEPVKTPNPAPSPKPTADPSVPVLTLKVSEVKVNAGQGPAWVDVIGTLRDDKDNYETLFRNLSVSKYDMNKAGTYQVTVSTEDSDGNKSQAVPLTIVVK